MEYDRRGRAVMEAFGAQLARAPMAHCALLFAVDFTLGPSFEIVISGKRGAEDVKAMAAALESVFLPNRVVVFRPADGAERIVRLAPFTKDCVPGKDGLSAVYVCREFSCQRPVTAPEDMLKLLSGDV